MRKWLLLAVLALLVPGVWAGVTVKRGPTERMETIPRVRVGKNFTLDANALGCWLIFSDTLETSAEADNCDAGSDTTMAYQDVDGWDWSAVPPGSPAGRNAASLNGEFLRDVHDAQYNSPDFTAGCWVSQGEYTNTRGLFALDPLIWDLRMTNAPSFSAYIGGAGFFSSAATVPVGDQWYHVAIRVDGTGSSPDAVDTKVEFFVNGVIDCDGAGGLGDCDAGGTPTGTAPINIGATGDAFPMVGDLYECIYFDRVLSDAEMAEWFLCGADGFADGLSRDAAFNGATCDAISSCC